MRYVKPLDEELIESIGRHFESIVTVEDGILRGGVGEAVIASLARKELHPEVRMLGIDDKFVEHGTPAELYALCGYDEEGISAAIESLYR